MRDLSSSQWRRRGSSVIFHQATLGDLLRDFTPVPLRAVLNWRETSVQPTPGVSTVLVHGLKPCLELFPPSDVEAFLRQRVKPFLRETQDYWPPCGVLFILGDTRSKIAVSGANEELVYTRADNQTVRLSFALWDGSSTLNITRLVGVDDAPREEDIIGFYVQRIS